ncbi:DNA topoisomerase IV subunit B [Arenicellales bacterium IMCC55707]|jgi:topoisomerase-4 subunit B|nr:DNA topoisomerase IV subunit B [Arenicellales bacterium]MDC1097059.1 DNA topoisomerase IV subunit B [Gammaproteobacteria bacterium]
MAANYDASAIEVLTGLQPVRKRPGMYTQTDRPNHLVQEVVDNSVDEAIGGYARRISVTLHKDDSVSVSDDGRGMPVDQHKGEKVSAVEVILTRLHAGGKFSDKSYAFSGGLHGVGVSVVNALSSSLEVKVKRNGKEFAMRFRDGVPTGPLKPVGKVGARNTGTTIQFWPDPIFFDSPSISVSRLKRLLRAKAVLCSGLRIDFFDQGNKKNDESWEYEDGLLDYLVTQLGSSALVPDPPHVGHVMQKEQQVDWALTWFSEGSDRFEESYVNLIPTTQGGSHVSGFRTGLTEAIREFCEFRSLVPRGVKIAPEDVWQKCAYVLSLRMKDPQFSGQTKDRLSSRDAASVTAAVVKDQFSLWLNQNSEKGEQIANLAIESAQLRMRSARQVERKKATTGPTLPGKLADCTSEDLERTEIFLVEGDSAGGSAKQARDREFQAILPLRGKILNTWEVDSAEVLGSQSVHDIAVALGVDPGSTDTSGLRYGRVCILADADSDGAHIATLLCALFVRHFRPLVETGRICVSMPPLYRIDVGKHVAYALDDAEKELALERIKNEKIRGAVNVQRFKGLGEMNPAQLRETTMDASSRRLIELSLDAGKKTDSMLDLLLARKRSPDRKEWLSRRGDQAEVS